MYLRNVTQERSFAITKVNFYPLKIISENRKETNGAQFI